MQTREAALRKHFAAAAHEANPERLLKVQTVLELARLNDTMLRVEMTLGTMARFMVATGSDGHSHHAKRALALLDLVMGMSSAVLDADKELADG